MVIEYTKLRYYKPGCSRTLSYQHTHGNVEHIAAIQMTIEAHKTKATTRKSAKFCATGYPWVSRAQTAAQMTTCEARELGVQHTVSA